MNIDNPFLKIATDVIKQYLEKGDPIGKIAHDLKQQFERLNACPTKEEPKQWEILEIKRTDCGKIIATKNLDKLWGVTLETALYWVNSNIHPCCIHSVKRLSDEEVFTVGDKLCGLGFLCKDVQEIKSIEIVNETIVFYFSYDGGVIINYAKKLKQPEEEPILIRTIDGYEFRGEQVQLYYIKPDSFEITPILSVNYWLHEKCKKGDAIETPINKWFHSKDEAEKYVTYTDKRYSIIDIQRAAASRDYVGIDYLIDDLKKMK